MPGKEKVLRIWSLPYFPFFFPRGYVPSPESDLVFPESDQALLRLCTFTATLPFPGRHLHFLHLMDCFGLLRFSLVSCLLHPSHRVRDSLLCSPWYPGPYSVIARITLTAHRWFDWPLVCLSCYTVSWMRGPQLGHLKHPQCSGSSIQ